MTRLIENLHYWVRLPKSSLVFDIHQVTHFSFEAIEDSQGFEILVPKIIHFTDGKHFVAQDIEDVDALNQVVEQLCGTPREMPLKTLGNKNEGFFDVA